MSELRTEISRRRTFAIISHPDAGKTTLTEKFLLYGGAIAQAGEVKGKRARAATSDWMEIEKQRGISVTSSVLQFQHSGFCINILDTPGHQDFSEDTYRTLMAADSAVMVIDGAKGVEPQTRKLFRVCAIRHIPIFTFINKMDRETKDPLELCEEVERELGIDTYAVNWPIGSGKEFQGVYDREKQRILFFQAEERGKKVGSAEVALDDPALEDMIGAQKAAALREEVELLGAGREFDMEAVRNGTLSPVFFGSALTTFGVEPFLEEFLRMTTPPLPRVSDQGEVDVFSEDFSAFVFKIQANMNKAHRDRLAFMRICSGKFERDTEYFHVQGNKKLRLSQPQQMMAAEREIIDEAYADFSEQKPFREELDAYPNLIVLNTFSKAWGSAAIRLGMAFASEEVISLFNKVKYPYNVNQLTQRQAVEILKKRFDVDKWVKTLLRERGQVMAAFAELDICEKIYPTNANFFLAKVKGADAIYAYLVKNGIIVRNRSRVELCGDCLRVTIGTPQEDNSLLGALRSYKPETIK